MFQCPVCLCDESVLDSEQMQCCAQCGFLTQEYHGEKVESEFTGVTNTRLRIYRSIKEKKVKKAEEKEPERPWRTDEGFQWILMEQSEALMELNANPKLKEAVFLLWVHYLRTSGRAFVEKPLTPAEKRSLFGTFRYRDRYPGTIENPRIYPYHLVLLALRALKKNETTDDNEEMRARFRARLEAQRMLAVREREAMKRVGWCADREVKAIQTMTMVKSLCLLHLALRLTDPRAQVYDLVRWVKQERVPYQKIPGWPQEMKFYGHDRDTFMPDRLPTSEELFSEARRVYRFLGLADCFPKPDVGDCARKIARELFLPEEFSSRVLGLMERHDPAKLMKDPYRTGLEPATLASCYIIMTLKFLLALDDVKERKASLLAEWLTERVKFERPLFNFMHWLAYARDAYNYSATGDLECTKTGTKGKIDGPQCNIFTCKPSTYKDSLWHPKRIAYLQEFHAVIERMSKAVRAEGKRREDDDDDNGDRGDDDDNRDDDDDDDDELKMLRKSQTTRLDSGGPDGASTWRKTHENPFLDATLDFFLDPEFLNGDGDGSGNEDETNDQIKQHQQSYLGLPAAKDPEGRAAIADLPLHLRPTYKPKYIKYKRKKLSKQGVMEKYWRLFHGEVQAQREEKNGEKADNYLDVLELFGRHIDVRPEQLEFRLQQLESYVFNGVDPFQEDFDDEAKPIAKNTKERGSNRRGRPAKRRRADDLDVSTTGRRPRKRRKMK